MDLIKKIALILLSMAATKSYSCIPIYSVPTTIQHPGTYCLTRDVAISDTSTSGIIIKSGDVLLDLKNHTLSGPLQSQSRSSGIESYHFSNIEIKNGAINHFMYGVRIQDTDLEKLRNNAPDAMHDIIINNLKLESNNFRGVMIQAKRVIIKDSIFRSTGGTTVFADSFSIPIETSGPDCLIKNNIIREFYPVGTGEGVGISLSAYASGCQIINNAISNSTSSKMGRTFGFWVGEPLLRNVSFIGNITNNMSYAANKPTQSDFSNNKYNNTHCADYFQNERYYLIKEPCPEENTEYFFIQANLGNSEYLFRLAVQYLEGMWVESDRDTSKHYFTLASELGHEEAKRILKKLWG
jgi:hypothetical protein